MPPVRDRFRRLPLHVSGPAQNHPGSLSTLTMAMLGGLVCVLVGGFLLLVLTGHDTSTYILFVAGPLVTTVVGALIGQRVKVVEEVARTVEAQTNGQLSESLSHIHGHIDEQTTELLEASQRAVVVPPQASGAGRLPAQQPAVGAEQNR